MSFTPEQVKHLQAPLGRSAVKQRSQAGRQLSYIESWHAIAEANRIFGFDGWNSHTRLKKLFDAYKDGKDLWRVGYMAKVTVMVRDGADWIAREGVGYGSGIDRDLGQSHESAIKEAESDARKRALMTFGNPFGLALYDKEQANVVDDSQPEPPPVEDVTQRKNPPGVAKVRTWLNDHVRDLHGCENAAQFMEAIEGERERWVKVRAMFPNLWEGPDGSGLRGEALKQATAYECRPSFDLFLKEVEAEAADYQQPKAAE